MKNYIKPSLIFVVLIVLGTFVFVGAQQNQNNFNQGTGSGSGTVSGNSGVVNAIATYAAAGGSTTVAPAANTACIPGATSGSVCLTAPSVAGTITNPLALTNSLAMPTGTGIAWNSDVGISRTAAGQIGIGNGTAGSVAGNLYLNQVRFDNGSGINLANLTSMNVDSTRVGWFWNGATNSSFFGNAVFGWYTGTAGGSALDTGISRSAGAVIAAGNGTAADTTGKLKAAGYMSVGTTFTSNAGCGDTTLVGGATAGKYTSVTAGTCTTVITMGNSATAPNGWSCTATDLTTAADAGNIKQTATTTTSASLNETTVVANDVIQFSCIGY